MKKKTIYVQMASYRDPQLIPTLSNMMAQAKRPKNLHVGICWQHGPDEPLDIFTDAGFTIEETIDADARVGGATVHKMVHSTSGTQLSVIDLYFHNTKGACWARNQIQQMYSGETYTLQLDSHHRFVKSFDTDLIAMLEGLREKSHKPLLTAYIPSFDPDNDPAGRVNEPWKMDFDRFIPEGAVFFIPSTIENWKELDSPIPARYFSAHFAFADGSFAVEVQHDPEYFFHGEEISIAARAYTHGYDLYHPHRVVAWHEYTRKGRAKVWDDHTTAQRNKGRVELDWVQRNDLCHKRNRILFGMDGEDPKQIEFGKYGFGVERSLHEYERYAGMSFKLRGVQQQVVDRLPPPGTDDHMSVEEWEATIVPSHDIRILFERGELGAEIADDYDFWYVGSADENEVEVFRKDAQAHEIKEYLKNNWVDFRLIWMGSKRASKFIVWPHSPTKGWGNRIVKDIPLHG